MDEAPILPPYAIMPTPIKLLGAMFIIYIEALTAEDIKMILYVLRAHFYCPVIFILLLLNYVVV